MNLLVLGCSIRIFRYSFPPPRKVHSESQEQSLFFFHFDSFCYGNAMQEVGKKVVFNDEKSFFLCYVKLMKTRYLKVGNVRRRLSVSDGKIPTVGISLKAQTERINGLLEGYLRHFSANQKDWSCWMLLSAAIT